MLFLPTMYFVIVQTGLITFSATFRRINTPTLAILCSFFLPFLFSRKYRHFSVCAHELFNRIPIPSTVGRKATLGIKQ